MGFFTEKLGSIGATVGGIYPNIKMGKLEKNLKAEGLNYLKERIANKQASTEFLKQQKLTEAAREATEREIGQYVQREKDYWPFSKKYTKAAQAAYSADADADYEKFRGLAWGELEDKLKPVKLPGGIDDE